MNTKQTLYERNFYAWTIKQADLLEQKKYTPVDFVHIIEKLETLGGN